MRKANNGGNKVIPGTVSGDRYLADAVRQSVSYIDITRRIKSEAEWITQSRRGCLTVIAAITVSVTGDGGDNPCGNCHLADTIIFSVSKINVAWRGRYINIISKKVRSRMSVPAESRLSPKGMYNVALVAAPPSPLKPPVPPLPAIVVIIPVDIVTLRIRLLKLSDIYTLPRNKIINDTYRLVTSKQKST